EIGFYIGIFEVIRQFLKKQNEFLQCSKEVLKAIHQDLKKNTRFLQCNTGILKVIPQFFKKSLLGKKYGDHIYPQVSVAILVGIIIISPIIMSSSQMSKKEFREHFKSFSDHYPTESIMELLPEGDEIYSLVTTRTQQRYKEVNPMFYDTIYLFLDGKERTITGQYQTTIYENDQDEGKKYGYNIAYTEEGVQLLEEVADEELRERILSFRPMMEYLDMNQEYLGSLRVDSRVFPTPKEDGSSMSITYDIGVEDKNYKALFQEDPLLEFMETEFDKGTRITFSGYYGVLDASYITISYGGGFYKERFSNYEEKMRDYGNDNRLTEKELSDMEEEEEQKKREEELKQQAEQEKREEELAQELLLKKLTSITHLVEEDNPPTEGGLEYVRYEVMEHTYQSKDVMISYPTIVIDDVPLTQLNEYIHQYLLRGEREEDIENYIGEIYREGSYDITYYDNEILSMILTRDYSIGEQGTDMDQMGIIYSLAEDRLLFLDDLVEQEELLEGIPQLDLTIDANLKYLQDMRGGDSVEVLLKNATFEHATLVEEKGISHILKDSEYSSAYITQDGIGLYLKCDMKSIRATGAIVEIVYDWTKEWKSNK
ncbi:MAG: hypothetical protein R3Y54_13425, partial [Eubacteriales bacterium]